MKHDFPEYLALKIKLCEALCFENIETSVMTLRYKRDFVKICSLKFETSSNNLNDKFLCCPCKTDFSNFSICES